MVKSGKDSTFSIYLKIHGPSGKKKKPTSKNLAAVLLKASDSVFSGGLWFFFQLLKLSTESVLSFFFLF